MQDDTINLFRKRLTLAACQIATINPFRYRGYYYDEEIELYYLQSRYYDAGIGRFVNSDESANIGLGDSLRSFNLYAYTENNPVSMIDEAGYAAINVICAAIGAIVGGSSAIGLPKSWGI